ncbi:MAG: PAS domain S-box protein [Hydrogenophaga sp.]|nr:PAS domain S-box protein [Hydrogenophaga sp.]
MIHTSPQPAVEHDDPLARGQSAFLLQQQQRGLGALLLALSLAAPLITLGVWLREGFSPLMAVCAGLTLVVWLCKGLFLRGRIRLSAHLVIITILLASVAGIAAHGTVRSAAVLVMVAGVVGAGAFLPRRTMIIAALFSVVALGVLNAMEIHGLLPKPNMQAGWAVWITQTSVLLSVLVSVFHGRNRMREAFMEQEQSLARALKSEAEQRTSEVRFTGLFRSNPAATLVQRLPSREVIDANDAFVRAFGHERDQLVGHVPPVLWADPADQLAFRAVLQTEGRVHGLRAQGVRQNGSTFEMLVYAEFVDEGTDRLVITMVLDVSAEVASRRALEYSEERFSKAFNFSPLGMTIARLSDGRFMEVNPSNERVLGYSQADLLGKTSLEAGVWICEQDRTDFIEKLRSEDRLEAYETRMRSKMGREVPVRIWAENIVIDGAPCSLAFTLNVEAEKHREALLIEMAQGVSGATGEAFFRSLVQHLARALQADLVIAGELDGPDQVQSLAACFAGEIVPDVRYRLEETPCARAIRAPLGVHFVNRMRTVLPAARFPIGEGFDTYLGIALRDADGSPIGVLMALWTSARPLKSDMQALMTIFGSRCTAELVRLRRDREISKLQDTLEQRVKARTEQLEYLNRELDSFAYSVSHDLKSPLRSIGGFSHLLREQIEGRMTDADRDLFDRVDTSVQRMNSLITDLLALARVSQGSLQRMNVNLSELAEDVIRQERHRDPTRTVQVKIAPGLMANCDARMAHIVLENLLGNAWKYTRQQPLALIELGEATRAPGQAPVFFVRDNGAGFDMTRADRLFKPFNRLHGSNEFEGSGVGLATVRRILERHGGRIRGEGQEGQGSVFEFSFGNSE